MLAFIDYLIDLVKKMSVRINVFMLTLEKVQTCEHSEPESQYSQPCRACNDWRSRFGCDDVDYWQIARNRARQWKRLASSSGQCRTFCVCGHHAWVRPSYGSQYPPQLQWDKLVFTFHEISLWLVRHYCDVRSCREDACGRGNRDQLSQPYRHHGSGSASPERARGNSQSAGVILCAAGCNPDP